MKPSEYLIDGAKKLDAEAQRVEATGNKKHPATMRETAAEYRKAAETLQDIDQGERTKGQA